jgi:hypothetical protein
MKAGEEIDALRALGVDPIDHLVLPRILALVTVAPLVMAYAALVGVLAGLPPAVGIYGVPASEYLHKCLAALTWTHLWIGLAKCTLYAVLLALAGCREGLHAGRDAQAVGEATTTRGGQGPGVDHRGGVHHHRGVAEPGVLIGGHRSPSSGGARHLTTGHGEQVIQQHGPELRHRAAARCWSSWAPAAAARARCCAT